MNVNIPGEGRYSIDRKTLAITESRDVLKSGADLIREERDRQIGEEGWSDRHDDTQHACGDLSSAAVCYALTEAQRELGVDLVFLQTTIRRALWPFGDEWWKPKDRIRDLVRAGALIAAEIDRLQRPSEQQMKICETLSISPATYGCINCGAVFINGRCPICITTEV